MKKCLNCGKDFEFKNSRKKYCCKLCADIYESKVKFSGTDAVICKKCGFMGNDLIRHIKTSHKMFVEEYCERYKCTKDALISNSCHNRRSNGQKMLIIEGRSHCFTSENNPSYKSDCKDGRNSPYSMNFRGYDRLSDSEKEEKIKSLKKTARDNMDDRCNNPLKMDYYIKRGMTKPEAEKALKDRQSTFTLEKCIEKYGEVEGKKIYEDRQERWQKTLKSKPKEEIERINRSKRNKVISSRGYSKISQELFWKIYNLIKNDYKEIYFATIDPITKNKIPEEIENNYEWSVVYDSYKHFFLDFYIKDNNKIIEFDGDYWHGNKRGNKERDRLREEKLKECGYNNILHIRERDYKQNPKKVIQECINYIKGK